MSLYRATIKGAQEGQTVDVITSWWMAAAPSASDALVLGAHLGDQWATHIMPALHESYGITEVDVVSYDDPSIGAIASHAAIGGSTASPMPAFCVANVQLRTGLRGRSNNGRFGIPGLITSYMNALDSNHLSADVVESFTTAVNALRDGMAGYSPGHALYVVSTISGGTPRPAPVGHVVDSIVVHVPIGTRVSRKG